MRFCVSGRLIIGLLFAWTYMTACGQRPEPAPSAPSAPSAPTPPPPPPTTAPGLPDTEAAIRRAKSLGVGRCDDIVKIKLLPFHAELGHDPEYDRVIVNMDGYRACLIDKLTDDTLIPDPAQGPTRYPYAVGNLAYDLLTDAGWLDYETCIPDEIAEDWDRIGVHAFIKWTAIEGHRKKLQACVIQHLSKAVN